jgi:hypothetical protein
MQFGPGLAATFLYYFTSTAILLTVVAALGAGVDVDTGIPQAVGAIGGTVSGVLGTYFNRTVSFTVPMQGQKKFLNSLDSSLNQLGYEKISQADNLRVYQQSSWRQWFSGRIFVQIADQQVTIASRASTIRTLKQIFQ